MKAAAIGVLKVTGHSKARFDMTVTKKDVIESYELLGRNVIDLGISWLSFHQQKNQKMKDFEAPTNISSLHDIPRIPPECDEVDIS